MNLFGMLELSGSALGAERQRAEVVASNMANAQTTRTPAGAPIAASWLYFNRSVFPGFHWRSPACNAKILRPCAWPPWFPISARRCCASSRDIPTRIRRATWRIPRSIRSKK